MCFYCEEVKGRKSSLPESEKDFKEPQKAACFISADT